MHDFKHGRLPSAFQSTWTENWQIGLYNLRNGNEYYIPFLRLRCLDNHPVYKLPRAWNELKLDFRNTIGKKKFKDYLKEYFLHNLDPNKSIECTCHLCLPLLQ